jgi:hypothetical protein
MHKDNSQIEDIFSEAWQKVATGDSIETAVSEYPEHAAELEPMLRLAAAMRTMPQPMLSERALARVRERAQSAAQEHVRAGHVVPAAKGGPQGIARGPQRGKSWFESFFPIRINLRTAMAVLFAIAVLGVLFKVGLSSQQPNPRQPLETYSGVITKMTATGWFIGDTEVLVEGTTEIHGQPSVGASMICIGQSLPGDRMRALEVWIDGAPGAPTVLPTHSDDGGMAPLHVRRGL